MKSLKRNVERRAVYSSKDHDAAVATLELRPDVRTAESGRSGPSPDVNAWGAYVALYIGKGTGFRVAFFQPGPRIQIYGCHGRSPPVRRNVPVMMLASLLGLMTVCFAGPHPSSYPLPLLVILQINNLIS